MVTLTIWSMKMNKIQQSHGIKSFFFLGMAVLTANRVCKPWRREGVHAAKSALPLNSLPVHFDSNSRISVCHVRLCATRFVLLLAFIFYLQYLFIIKMDKFFFKYVSKVKMVVKWNQFQLTLLTKKPMQNIAQPATSKNEPMLIAQKYHDSYLLYGFYLRDTSTSVCNLPRTAIERNNGSKKY